MLVFAVPGASAAPPTPYDRVLTVGFAPSANAASRVAARHDAGVQARGALAAPGLQQVIVPASQSLAAAAARLRAAGSVDFVELPGSYTTNALTNDPYVVNKNVWGLNNDGSPFACMAPLVGGVCPNGQSLSGTNDADIDAPEAWDVLAGGPEPVAIVDTGVAWQHQDLAANIWSNVGETGGGKETNGIDDDGDGYVDDYHGWDFVGDLNGSTRNPPDNNPADPSTSGHGTHVAGIAGAVGNNLKGIAGVNPGATIMPLRAADEGGTFSFGAIEDAFSYAIDHGVRVINGSFSGSWASPAMSAIINANPQVLFVFAAGNSATNHDASSGLDHWFPCDLTEPNIICVAATDWNDQLANFSDYGFDSVDLAAPGAAILSTIPSASDPTAGGDYDYQYMDGTSMASPHIAGAASLIWSAYPGLASSQVKTLIVTHTDALQSLSGKIGFGGRLNLDTALVAAANPPPVGWPVTPSPPTGSGGTTVTAPADLLPVPTVLDTRPPDLRVISARKLRVGASGRLRFNVICGERCWIAATARPNVRGLHAVTSRSSADAGQTRTIGVRFKGDALRRLHRALRARGRVGVFITVTVADTAGNKAPPRSFRISLVR